MAALGSVGHEGALDGKEIASRARGARRTLDLGGFPPHSKQWKRKPVRYVRLRQRNAGAALAAQTVGSPHGPWRTVLPCPRLSRLLTSMRSVFHDCGMASSSTELNRRMRTRMYGGVAGESR